MRAVVAREGRLSLEQLNIPSPAQGQVLVKTLICGICGSDLHALDHMDHLCASYRKVGVHPLAIPDPAKPMIFGHEFCAEVVDYGVGATKRLKPGTRVCASPFQVGSNGVETVGLSNNFGGGFGEYMCLNESQLLEVPNGLSSEMAALAEPMAVGLHAVNRAQAKSGDVALVLGCGPIGLAVIAALKVIPDLTVIAVDYSEARRSVASALGADMVIDAAKESPFERWNALGCPAGLHDLFLAYSEGKSIRRAVIFECVGIPGMLQNVVEGAPVQAKIVVAGVCMSPDIIEPNLAITKELDIRFVLAYSEQEFSDSLTGIAEGRYQLSPLISDVIDLTGVEKTFQSLQTEKEKIKVLIKHN